MYNFMKIKTTKGHRFRHQNFLKNNEGLLKLVKRRPENKKKKESSESIDEKENQAKTLATVFQRSEKKKVSFAMAGGDDEESE